MFHSCFHCRRCETSILQLRPEGDTLFQLSNNKRVKGKASTTNHLVLDLCSIEGLPANFQDIASKHKEDLSSSFAEDSSAEIENIEIPFKGNQSETAPAALVASDE